MNKVLFETSEISSKVKELGQQISIDYAERNPMLVCVLQGGFIFFADLVRSIDIDIQTEFIRASSYRSGLESTGVVKLFGELLHDVKDRHVILVDDIVDTGLTQEVLKASFLERGAQSAEIACLLLRDTSDCVVKYHGFRIGPGYVIGYGMDAHEKYRNLPSIQVLE